MANISIRKLDDSIKQALQRAAAAQHCSLEEYARRALAAAAESGGGGAAGQEARGACAGAAAAKGNAAARGGGEKSGAAAESAAQMPPALGALRGRHVLLLIGGSVAAYKALELIRILRRAEAKLQIVMTAAARRFITPQAVEALAAARAYTELFSREQEQDIGHIRLARNADMVIFAALSASRMAKMAAGQADDLAGAVLLANRAPLLLAPAMNPAMWAHPATQRNYARLKADGCLFIGPEYGEMAESNEAGLGRMSAAADIAAAAAHILQNAADSRGVNALPQANAAAAQGENAAHILPAAMGAAGAGAAGADAAMGGAGKRILITAGPTYEAIDPVRYLANHSSGRQGYALAAALAARGARVKLISGPVALPAPQGVEVQRVITALEMQAAVQAALPADAAVFVAAVADWRPERAAAEKLKKQESAAGAPLLRLVENPDILAGVGHSAARPKLVIGFAAETADLAKNAAAKLAKKGADWIIANNVARAADGSSVMGGAKNQIHIFSRGGVESWAEMPKEQVAALLAEKILAALAEN